jgi:putative Holliday junction resolvase
MSAQTYLAFDFGQKRIGVAVGQDLTRTASALTTLKTRDNTPPWDQISALVQTWQPQALVVGLPYNKDGSEHAITQAARKFGNQLQGRYQRPVYWVDERLTSHEAERILAERGVRAKREDIDKVAAQLILQSWFEQQTG